MSNRLATSSNLCICFLDRATYASHLTLRRPVVDHQWQEYLYTEQEDIVTRLAQVNVAVTNKVPLQENILSKLPQLRFISLTATGYNNIDIDYCRKAGIGVANIRDYATTTLCEHTISLMLACSRSVVPYHQSVVTGKWSQSRQFCYFDFPIIDLAGSTLCIIGKGNLGSAVGRMALALGMHVVYAEHKHSKQTREGYLPFYQALGIADVISIHCPLSAETNQLLGEKEFAAMHKNPLIINTARGALIDEIALCQALDAGQVRGVALDVLSSEPPSIDNPLLQQPRTNLLITPHIAWASDKGQLAAWEQAMENIERWYMGSSLRRLV